MGDSLWSNQRLDLIVLQEAVSGFSGLFGYSPSIGAGKLIFSVAAVAGTDPYGNAYPAGLSVTGTSSVITGTNYVVNASGAFFYSGTPATGNLIASIASAAGTDAFGNAFPAGIMDQNGAGSLQTVIHDAGMSLTKLSGALAPPLILLADNTAVATPASTFLRAGGITTPVITAVQPGTTGTVETWHALTPITSFTGTCRYRLTADNCVRIQINGTFSVTGTVSLGTLPAAYIPSGNNGTSPYAQPLSEASGTFNNLRWDISSAGAINARGIPATAVTISGMSDWALD